MSDLADPSFIHLRVHSAYSLAEGAIKLKDLIKATIALKMPAIAVTDTNNLFGALEYADAAAEAGLQPIIGTEIFFKIDAKTPLCPIVLLVQSEQGYLNLLAMMSNMYLRGNEDLALMREDFINTEGLICLSGGAEGPLGYLMRMKRPQDFTDVLEFFKTHFDGRFYLELQRHGTEEENLTEAEFIDLAYAQNLPLVATNHVLFKDRRHFEAQDVLSCIAQGVVQIDPARKRRNEEYYLKSPAEMIKLFEDLPEAIQQTVQIAKRCHYYPTKRKPILPKIPTEAGRTEAEELAHEARTGLEFRLKDIPDADLKTYQDRLEFELETINNMGFSGYFLIVSDFIKWAKKQGIPVGPGRGSGAGSVVAWCLLITDLDPLRFGLLFERFLNPERVSMPDFDIDFCQDRRDEVISYVQEKYGRKHVAQIITFGKLQARAVLRDVGRVLGMPYGQVDKITKMIPNNPAAPVTLEEAINNEPELRRMQREDDQIAKLMEIGLELEGLYRHASTHAAGVVIADRDLDSLIPLYRDPKSDMPVTQFNMKYAENAGLVKFDFLGLKTLSVLRLAVEMIEKNHGVHIDLEKMPLDDAKTYEMLSRGNTSGIFQLESSGMRDVVKKLQPDRFEEIIALVALYRPGPMDNIPHFIAVKKGEEEADYMHPSLEPILRETYGIMVYQEQVMQIAQVLAGYSLGSADLLRRAMGKKIKSEMDEQRQIFIDGAIKNGVEPAKAGFIFDQVDKFAGYGFNKSHAAAYALIAYQTAYLKANYPHEFMAATMSYDLNNTDKLIFFIGDLNDAKIKLLPPDVNHSKVNFWPEKKDDEWCIRYALAAIKNVGEGAMTALISEREEKGEFTSLANFAGRVDAKALNKRSFEHLIFSGAFDALEPNRRAVYEGIDLILAHAAGTKAQTHQSNLFAKDKSMQTINLPKVKDWQLPEKLKNEFSGLGFYLSSHPLARYKSFFESQNILQSDRIETVKGATRSRYQMVGIVTAKKERISAKGSKYAFISLNDLGGDYEVMVFSEVLASSRDLLEVGQQVQITVDVKFEEDRIRLMGQKIVALSGITERAAKAFRLVLDTGEKPDKIKNILSEFGPRPMGGQIEFYMNLDGKNVALSLRGGYVLNDNLKSKLMELSVIRDVEEVYV